jgi:hypothetical protein
MNGRRMDRPISQIIFAIWAAAVSPVLADETMAIPNEEVAAIEFTLEATKALRDLRTFADLQRAVGATGILAGHVASYQRYHWKGAHDKGDMNAIVFASGDFRAVVHTNAHQTVTFSNFGEFLCAACTPPVNACGRRPSWISADLHWDNWDCEHPPDR